jgi:hypothetical protein
VILKLVEVGDISEARFVSFAVNLNNITKDRLYEVMIGRPIAIDEVVGRQLEHIYPNEHYIVNDSGRKQHGIWAFIKTKYYK